MNFAKFELTSALVIVGLGVFAGFFATWWFQLFGADAPLPFHVMVISWLASLCVYLFARMAARLAVYKYFLILTQLPDIWVAVVTGLALRLIIALVLAPNATSDGASYLALAHQLIESGSYGGDGARAYWPPGLPFVLAVLLKTGVSSSVATLLYGAICYLSTAWGLSKLSQHIGLQKWARAPQWLLGLWPTHVLCSGLPEKELLVITLLVWVVYFSLHSMSNSRWSLLVAGVLMGFMVLVQPSFQLLPLGALGLALLCRVSLRKTLLGGGVVLLGMALVICPWAIRNSQVFESTVLVTTNGGDVLYRANNEKATGAYTPVGAVDLSSINNEIDKDKLSKKLAFEWIFSHPMRFAQLSMGKILLFLGDDSYGAYTAIRKGRPQMASSIYFAVKLISAIPWLVIWFMILVVAHPSCKIKNAQENVIPIWLILMPVFYLMGIHAVFESGPKYHLPLLGLVLAVFGYCMQRANESAQ